MNSVKTQFDEMLFEYGEYDHITSANSLSEILTKQLREDSQDLHFRVNYTVDPKPIRGDQEKDDLTEWKDSLRD